MEGNNIAVVLETLGAKIAEQQKELEYAELRYNMLSEHDAQLMKDNEAMKQKLDSLTAKINTYCAGGKN